VQPEVHPLLAGLPTTITKAEEALPLARFIDEHVPAELRDDPQQNLNLSLWLNRADEARLNGNHKNRGVFEGNVVHKYPFALNALGRFLAERDGLIAPAPMQTQVAVPSRAPMSAGTTATAPVPLRAMATTTLPVVMSPPSDAVKSAVLRAAPNLFQVARMSTGMAAVVFEFVRSWKIYKESGFESMSAYAEAHLGVKGRNNYREYARGGKAAWTHYAALAQRLIEAISGGVALEGVQLHPPLGLPSVPSVSLLRELPRALKRTDPSEHAEVLARVQAGECTYEELRAKRQLATTAEPVVAANDATPSSDADDGSEGAGGTRPTIFDDVPELEEAARLTREAMGFLDRLVGAWDGNGGNDVDPILPRVRALAAKQKSIATELEDHIIPRTICASCSGEGCRVCRGMGWLPRVPLRTGPKKAAPRPRAKTVRRVPGHKKNETRRAK
jgi:hypothetical protein